MAEPEPDMPPALGPAPNDAAARRRIIAARNRVLALALLAMAGLFFAITLVKLKHGG